MRTLGGDTRPARVTMHTWAGHSPCIAPARARARGACCMRQPGLGTSSRENAKARQRMRARMHTRTYANSSGRYPETRTACCAHQGLTHYSVNLHTGRGHTTGPSE